jgi:hypothetical protein
LDWNADGVVNLIEFNKFSCAWLSHDPNDPAWSDPNLVDPNDVAAWKACCNLDDTGDSTYTIDLYDFTEWLNDWLWTACWYEGYTEAWGMTMAMGGGESLLLSESLALQPEQIEPVEKTIEEQLENAKVIIEWLEEISKEKDFFGYIDKKTWAEFVESIYNWLSDLEAIVDDKYSY